VVHLDFIALSESATTEAVEDLISEAAGLTQLESVLLAGVIRTERALPDADVRHREEPGRSGPGVRSTPHASSSQGVHANAPGAQPTLSRVGADPGVSPHTAASDFDLAFFFVLDRFTSLEPFGTDPRYIRFLQGKAARILRAFAGADIALTAPFPEVEPYATCLALMAPDQTYDWEVRSALESWTRQTIPPHEAEPGRSGPGALSSDPLSSDPSLSREGTGPSSEAPRPAANAIGLAIGERQRYRGCVLSFTTTASTPGRLADRRFESTLIAGRTTRF
jgi:hypothetical protein